MEGLELTQDTPSPTHSAKEIYLPQRDKGQRIRDKDRKSRMWGKEKDVREREIGYLPQRDKGLPLDRDKTAMVHRQMAVYIGKERSPVLG